MQRECCAGEADIALQTFTSADAIGRINEFMFIDTGIA